MINVLYEDNHIIVVEKPAGVLSQSDISGDPDMLSMVKEYVRVKYSKKGEAFIGLLHRLDRPVGGVMVFARTSKAASRISEQIRNRTFMKTYLAVVNGIIENNEGELCNYLKKNNDTNTVSVVEKTSDKSLFAKLTYKIKGRTDEFSFLEINLETGRPHQIRVQFSNIGHSLFGDNKYGDASSKEDIALWSHKIQFMHPVRKELMTFNSSPSRDKYPWSLF